MCVVAHPDDECFAFGGALALAAERGIETYVICMTDGQAAKHRGDAASGADLGRVRRQEFEASCKVLGVARHEVLDYHDGELTGVPIKEVAGRLVERIRSFRPDIVITFGSDGGANLHPDHMMVSLWTTVAFHWSGQSKQFPHLGDVFRPRKLYYQTTKFFIPNRQPPQPMPWTVALDIRSVEERKYEAFRRHVSQAPLMEQTREYFAKYGSEEFYSLVAADDPQPAGQFGDLFDGLGS
jgi:LmbE family N-acetylglucosaminyl deacetylase